MTQRALLQAGMKQRVVVDIIWLLWIILGFTLFLFLGVFVDPDPTLAQKGVFGGLLLLTGTFLTGLLVGFNPDWTLSGPEMDTFFQSIFIALVAIFVVNFVTPSLSVSPMSNAMFSVLIGIAEEAFFRGFLLTWVLVMTGNPLIAIGISSLVGTTYHAAVYGLSNQLMGIVFGSFCVLGFSYIMSGRRLSTCMTAHALINVIATLGGA